MIIICNLENYSICLSSIQELDAYKKSKLFLVLLNLKNPLSVKLMALLCTTYDIYEKKYWKAIVKSATAIGMVGFFNK